MTTDSDTRTRTAQTVHGDVAYETADCSSCGLEYRKDDLGAFVIADRIGGKYHNIDQVTLNGNFATGYVCETCRADPAGYPTRSRAKGVLADIRSLSDAYLYDDVNMMKEVVFVYVVISAMMWAILLLVGVVAFL